MNKLNKYQSKRNFNKTKEPLPIKRRSGKKLRFVVQHHLARKDHYDLRLEYQGVMKSFAIPKGLSYNPKDKRLAIKVEDHPLSYRNFEGTIPKGEYGGGTVMIFDEGYWEPISKPNFNKEIKFILKGIRLKGKWTLIPFKDNNYLIIKEKDEYNLYDDITKINTSIKTNRTMNEIKNNQDTIKLTSPNKKILPKLTKIDIFNYYKKVAIRMLPYLNNRLLSTIRCPNGIIEEKFFMKHFDNKYLGKKIIKNNNKKEDYYYIKDINGLLYEVQMNSYEFHIWGSMVNRIKQPDIMVFDFDPDEKLSLIKLRQGVKDLKKILDDLNITSYLKTSGGKGYHVIAKVKSKNWEEHRKIAKDIAKLMEIKYPDKYTSNIRKKNRKNKIFIDWVRNTYSATSVAPYSLRLKESASISMPIKWSELDKVKPDEIKIEDALKRLKRIDPWKDFFIN